MKTVNEAKGLVFQNQKFFIFIITLKKFHNVKKVKLTQFTGQSKVNDLNERSSAVETDDVFWLQVEVYDAFTMKILNSLHDLSHVVHTCGFCVLEMLVYDALKQLATGNTGINIKYGAEKHLYFYVYPKWFFFYLHHSKPRFLRKMVIWIPFWIFAFLH